jgi:hypothetical protein
MWWHGRRLKTLEDYLNALTCLSKNEVWDFRWNFRAKYPHNTDAMLGLIIMQLDPPLREQLRQDFKIVFPCDPEEMFIDGFNAAFTLRDKNPYLGRMWSSLPRR